MEKYLLVGAGGAIGAMLRYLLSSVSVESAFPATTFITNVLGAVLIGIIVGVSVYTDASPGFILFLKTGVCGGFTTFSTFSLESLNLLEQRRFALAGAYMLLSLLLCVAGVYVGRQLCQKLVGG